MLTQRRRARLLGAAGSLAIFAVSLVCCAAPPPPAAAHPFAAPPAEAKIVATVEKGCGAVQRAKRTWVGFAEGMTLDDMVPAGHAAEMVVRTLDTAVCKASRGEVVPSLDPHRASLQTFAADGGKLEVTKVLWQDVTLTHALVELHGLSPRTDHWRAAVVRRGETWKLASFDPESN